MQSINEAFNEEICILYIWLIACHRSNYIFRRDSDTSCSIFDIFILLDLTPNEIRVYFNPAAAAIRTTKTIDRSDASLWCTRTPIENGAIWLVWWKWFIIITVYAVRSKSRVGTCVGLHHIHHPINNPRTFMRINLLTMQCEQIADSWWK